jgi:hypothetical protein
LIARANELPADEQDTAAVESLSQDLDEIVEALGTFQSRHSTAFGEGILEPA